MDNQNLCEFLWIETTSYYRGTAIVYPLWFLYESDMKTITDIEKECIIYQQEGLFNIIIQYAHMDRSKPPIIAKQYLGMTLDELYNIIKSLWYDYTFKKHSRFFIRIRDAKKFITACTTIYLLYTGASRACIYRLVQTSSCINGLVRLTALFWYQRQSSIYGRKEVSKL